MSVGVRHSCLFHGIAVVASGVLLAVVAPATAAARTAYDPCGSNPHVHLGWTQHLHHNGRLVLIDEQHCGAIFDIPAHRTESAPEMALPAPCLAGAPDDWDHVAGFTRNPLDWGGNVLTAQWDYWTKDGAWVLWDGGYHLETRLGFLVTEIRPRFHNWHGQAWPVRVFFVCSRQVR